jgi:hypothetical protein
MLTLLIPLDSLIFAFGGLASIAGVGWIVRRIFPWRSIVAADVTWR